MKEEIETLIIDADQVGERLDKALVNHYKNTYSRTYFQKLIDDGMVLINGSPAKKRIKLEQGDEVEVEFALTPEIDLTPENIPLDILYEDDHIIAVNKPAGMVVHPATGNWSGTFVNALLYHCKHDLPNPENLRPGIVHRLDKETSGLLLAAKTTDAHQKLIQQFASREIQKEYIAVCLGNPGNALIEAPIARDPRNRQRMAVANQGGKSAITSIETLSFKHNISIVKAYPKTGRTHQIRVHLKHRGTPILGDKLYGNKHANANVDRQLLHAHMLSFKHPITSSPLHLTAPPPADIQEYLTKLGKDTCAL